MRGHRYSDPDRPLGNVHSTQRLLRTRLPLASLLVRETVQNSWDARVADPATDTPPVRYSVQGRHLSSASRRALRQLLADPPPDGLPPRESTGPSLSEVLGQNCISVMTVTDLGTFGLNGPARSDVTGSGGRRFVRFLLDMGREPDQALAGGTYGYGKTVLWRASVCSTVVAYSRFRSGRHLHSRLMGAALGDPYVTGEQRFTGRHWWGLEDLEVGVRPIEGDAADEVADALDLPDFPERATGTSVMIVGARLEGRDGLEAVRDAARWHCWPKLVPLDGRPDMEFDFLWEQEQLPAIDPLRDPELRPLASSLVRVFDGEGEPCQVKKPIVVAGHFAYDLVPRRPAPASASSDRDDEDAVRPFDGELNHVAWIRRGPRLLVRYEPLPADPPDPTLRAGGVFVTADDTTRNGLSVEDAFALSEPPTHDDWSWRDLDRGEAKTIVRTGLSRLDEATKRHLKPPGTEGTASGLVGLANLLGDLIPEGSAPGGNGPPTTRGRETRRRPLRVREEAPQLYDWEGTRWGVLPFTLEGERGGAVELEAVLSVVDADGGTNRIDPEELSEDVYWQQDDLTEYPGWALTVLPDVSVRGWHLWVPVEGERRVRLSVNVRTIDG